MRHPRRSARSWPGQPECSPHRAPPTTRASPLHTTLTRREIQVITQVAGGCSNKEIGTRLSLSALTVKNHLARIGRKLGTGDRAQLVALACRAGIIT